MQILRVLSAGIIPADLRNIDAFMFSGNADLPAYYCED